MEEAFSLEIHPVQNKKIRLGFHTIISLDKRDGIQ